MNISDQASGWIERTRMETPVASRPVSFSTTTLSVLTSHARQFVDITDKVTACLHESGITNGLAVVASLHTTAAIVVNEHEPELFKDLDNFLAVLASEDMVYAHNSAPCGPDEMPNGHSHCQALLLNTSASIPIVAGRLHAGQYQRVFLVELDHGRPRAVTVTLLGA